MRKFALTGTPADYYQKLKGKIVLNEENLLPYAESYMLDENAAEVVYSFFSNKKNALEGIDVASNVCDFLIKEGSKINQEKIKNKSKSTAKKINIGVNIFFLGVVGLIIFGLYKIMSPSEPKCDSEVGAFVMSQNFVKRQLKFPSTAKFPYIDDSAVLVYGDSNTKGLKVCKYSVHAYVDSKNALGLMVNSKYTVDLEYNVKTQNWKATQVFIQ